MTHRPRNHVLEGMSRDALSRQLTGPLGWVVRDIPIDYGIDAEVEIFDDGSATGLTFKVQLKGMEKPDHIGPFRDVEVNHLRYWGRLDVPVLLVAYDDSTQRVFARWIHSLDLELKPDQKKKRIRFTDEDQIHVGDTRLQRTVEAARRLKSGLFSRPFPVRLDSDRASELVHEFFAIVRALGPDDYVRLDRSDFAFAVSVAAGQVRVVLPAEIGSFTLHPQPVGTTEDLLRDSLVILAGLLVRLNRFGEAAQITRRMVGNCRASSSPELALELATAAYEVGDHDLLIKLAVEAFKMDAFDACQIYLMVLGQMPGEAWFDSAREVLEPEIQRCVKDALDRGEPSTAAFWAYNYAQLLFAKKARDDARQWVQRALDLDPKGYGSRPEPQRLLGAIAWFAGDMSESVDAYRTAVAKGGLEAAGSALADSLMHAGLHTEARDIVSQVLTAGSDNWRDWFVDAILTEFVDHLDLPQQARRDYPPMGTDLSGRTVEELDEYLKNGYALNEFVWLAKCVEHPVDRLTTLMCGAYLNLSEYPFLMAGAVAGMIEAFDEQGELDEVSDNLAQLFFDHPEVRAVLVANVIPLKDELRDFVKELGLRSLELTPRPPGVQLVDENNIVYPESGRT